MAMNYVELPKTFRERKTNDGRERERERGVGAETFSEEEEFASLFSFCIKRLNTIEI